MTWNQRRVYINLLLTRHEVKRQRNRKNENASIRHKSLLYSLEVNNTKVRVCKKMFLNTLGVGERMVSNWLKKNDENTNPSQERVNCISEKRNQLFKQRIETLKMFFNEMPKVESHYCRASSTKLYLEPNWQSKSELFNFYKDFWCKEKESKPLSIATFYNIFDEMNLSIFAPKKDQCDVCVAYKTKNIPEDVYVSHQLRKKEAREEKDKDKLSSNRVFCMDLQSVLLCPKSNVSSLYFKTKLTVHNFTFYDLHSKNGYCFLWHEAAGGLTANDYSSIICNFLEDNVIKNLTAEQSIVIFSDGCTSQNRNVTLANALVNLSVLHNVTIEQKFLEKGHTQMEADSIHSTIERKLKNIDINVPADYVGVCLKARKFPSPYKVKYLDYTFFKDFGSIKFLTSLRPGRTVGDPLVTHIRAIKYSPNGTVHYKLRHSEGYMKLCNQRNSVKTCCAQSVEKLPNLYGKPISIKKNKFEHLQSLKRSLPEDYHPFYDNLNFR